MRKALIVLSFVFLVLFVLKKNDTSWNKSFDNNPYHPLKFYDEITFQEGISHAAKINKPLPYKISGGIIPHHLLPGFIIADIFKYLSFQKITTIFLLGPNHFEKGGEKVLTSLYDWETPDGLLKADKNTIYSLVESGLVKVNEEVVSNDFSVSGPMPFIKHLMPNVRVVPILISGRLTEEESRKLASKIREYIKEGVVVVSCVDFSHGKMSKVARENDLVTKGVITSFDYRQLYSMGNEYLDSPPSIGTLLVLMESLGKKNVDILENTNSGILLKNDSAEVTSYFSVVFH